MPLTYNAVSKSHLVVTAPQIQTTSTNNTTDSVGIAPYSQFSVQLVWASITGAQPAFKVQTSNNGTNWDDTSGATHTTSGASGSHTIYVSGATGRLARVAVSTASTTGTMDATFACTGR